MPFTFTMPKLSPTMETGVVAKWTKQEGDHVDTGDVVLEVTTDKATVEHAALDAGFLRKILIQEGQEASVNQAIAIFTETKDESIEGYVPEGTAPVEEKAEENAEQPKEESQEEAATAPATTSFSQPAFVPIPPLEGYQFEFPSDNLSKRIAASPLAKKLAKEKNLDLTTVKGTGPGGRIVSEDLTLAQPGGLMAFGRRSLPQEAPGAYEEKPLSPIQKVVGERLQSAKTFIPHFYITQDIDAGPMQAIREQLKAQNIRLSFNDFVLKASAMALRAHPTINSGYNSMTQSIIRFKTVDISIAVSLDEGLITPIVRHADYKNIGELNIEVKQLAKKARDGTLALEEFQGGSFCISNVGMYGVTQLFPVINPPQAAILGVGGIQEVPIVKNKVVVPGSKMTLTVAADHRAINGSEAAEFLRTLRGLLENPASLLL